MPLPDKHADEPTVAIDADLFFKWQQAKASVAAWTVEYERLKKLVYAQVGDAFAATVDGEKVLTYRPQVNYADARLRKDYPDLTEHFMTMKVETVFDVDAFAAHHPEIAEKYRVRALKEV